MADKEAKRQEVSKGVFDAEEGEKKKPKPLSLNFLYKLIKANNTLAQ